LLERGGAARHLELLYGVAPQIFCAHALAARHCIACECAEPQRLQALGLLAELGVEPVWIGNNPNKGLAVFAYNGYAARLSEPFYPCLRYIAPIRISGPSQGNLLGVWARNASAGVLRKHQLGRFAVPCASTQAC
jgi:hypothetical protein